MMIADSAVPTHLPRSRRAGLRASSSPGPRGFVFAVAALPGEAEGFRWPSWLSPVARSFTPPIAPNHSSKRTR